MELYFIMYQYFKSCFSFVVLFVSPCVDFLKIYKNFFDVLLSIFLSIFATNNR